MSQEQTTYVSPLMTFTSHNSKTFWHEKKHCKKLVRESDNTSNVKKGTRKWCSYHHSNGHPNEKCYQQQQWGKRWCTYHKNGNHSDDQCYHQINDSRNSPADSKNTKYEKSVADSDNVTGCDICTCNGKVESKSTGDDEPNNTPPDIGFNVAMCHPLLSQKADGFQLLVDARSPKHFIDPELIRGVESTMLEYTRK